MNIIQLLPDDVANQIAAGEVIQRPASVVKELLENALDSGADQIKIYIKDAGKTSIQVIDNGCGMSEDDVKLCFERHATSKIKDTQDLFLIKTMGFRGEALNSISAIAHVDIRTKLRKNETGSKLVVEGGDIKNHSECACNEGTSIQVKNLFYNVPARRKFLKSDNIENRHIIENFTRIAIANPKINMQLYINQKELFHLKKSNLRQRIVNVIGGRKNEALVPIKENTSLVDISGFIGKPETAKKTRGEQYFFTNARFIKNNYLNHAVKKAFSELIPENYFPSYFINLKIDPKLIDINIHPTKTEIKFQDEKAIYSIIRSTIKKSLGEYNITPSIDFSQEMNLDFLYQKKTDEITPPKIRIDHSYNPFNKQHENLSHEKIQKQIDLYKIKDENNIQNNNVILYQIKNEYITSISQDSLMIIHQRRAHKRILFDYFINLLNKDHQGSQQLLFSKNLTFNKVDMQLIINLEKSLNKVGFFFREINKEEIEITSIPHTCKEENIQPIIEEILENYKTHQEIPSDNNKKLAITLANNLSIRNKKKLSYEEMIRIKNDLLKCSNPTICPLGKKIIMNLDKNNLKKYFSNV